MRTHQRTRYSIRALHNSSTRARTIDPSLRRQVYIVHLSIMKKVARSAMGKELRTCPTAISLIPAGPWSTRLAWFSFLINFFNSHRFLYSTSQFLRSSSATFKLSSSSRREDRTAGSVWLSRILMSLSPRRNHRFEMSIIFIARLVVRSMGAKWRQSSRGIFRKYRYQRGFYWTEFALRLRFRGERAGAPLFPRSPHCASPRSRRAAC